MDCDVRDLTCRQRRYGDVVAVHMPALKWTRKTWPFCRPTKTVFESEGATAIA